MKIIGVAASPRKNKSSHFLLEKCLESIQTTSKQKGSPIDIELIDLAPMRFSGCIACDKCKKGPQCSLNDDFQQLIPKLSDPDLAGIVISTPVYMGSMTSLAKAFLDRTVLHRRNGFLFRDKIGGVIAVGGSRNGGQELTSQAIHAAMMIHDMIIVGDGGHFGGAAWANHPGGYSEDTTGIETAQGLGQRMATIAMKQ
jgi:multimeric flavodoxin WrbA